MKNTPFFFFEKNEIVSSEEVENIAPCMGQLVHAFVMHAPGWGR